MTAAPSPQADLVGAILSKKYPLKRLIGAGGMGSVYETENPEDKKPLAVKVLSLDYTSDEDIKTRFLEEGRTCQRLVHPNIVRVFDVATAEDGTPYIVMELLDGMPLSAYTRSAVRVPMLQAANILQGILAGLGAAHAQGIIHRDLKPENVFLAREPNGTFTGKILDFGIAKVMDAAGGMGNKTRTGVLLGTPAYMSPEQIKSSKDVDARTDLWSAGVMLYEMLTGRVAFPAPTEYARLNAVLNVTPPTLEMVDPQLQRLSAFVQTAMQKDRNLRHASALDMARALRDAIGDAGLAGSAMPLSRLPDVPSVWAPTGLTPAPSGMPATITATAVPMLPAPAMHTPGPDVSPNVGPGGTLTSKPGLRVSDPPPQVKMVASHGTLPSENLPMFSAHGGRRGVPIWLAAVLVVGALVAGVLIGFALGRMR